MELKRRVLDWGPLEDMGVRVQRACCRPPSDLLRVLVLGPARAMDAEEPNKLKHELLGKFPDQMSLLKAIFGTDGAFWAIPVSRLGPAAEGRHRGPQTTIRALEF